MNLSLTTLFDLNKWNRQGELNFANLFGKNLGKQCVLDGKNDSKFQIIVSKNNESILADQLPNSVIEKRDELLIYSYKSDKSNIIVY